MNNKSEFITNMILQVFFLHSPVVSNPFVIALTDHPGYGDWHEYMRAKVCTLIFNWNSSHIRHQTSVGNISCSFCKGAEIEIDDKRGLVNSLTVAHAKSLHYTWCFFHWSSPKKFKYGKPM